MSKSGSCPKCGADLPANAPEGICPTCLLQAGLSSESVANDSPDLEPTSAMKSGFVPPKPEELAGQFPQLEILELLGKGGMGAVYKARQLDLDRLVAVKILPPEIGSDPAFAHRFAREARTLAKLSHQNIVSVYDFGKVDGQYYFMMEYVDGANLRHLMESNRIQPEAALAIVPQLCEALQFAHQQGVVHRDIKPENILVDKQGQVKIADFGLVKLLDKDTEEHRLTGTRQAMGTLHYMAPEQMQGASSVDNRADIYSLGVVFYEMLTGQLPIGRFAPPSKRVQVDVRLDEVVLRALESEPEQRYQHASDVRTDIESITDSAPPSKTDTAASEHIDREPGDASVPMPRFSRKAILGAAWAPFFVIVLLSFFIVSARTSPEGSPDPVGWNPIAYLQTLLLFVVLPLGITAPFGTTTLGLISLSEIRHSRGRLVGLPLALADALLFPLLLIDLIILVACANVPVTISTPILLIAGLLICAIVDFMIIRWAWRQAKGDNDIAASGGRSI